MRILLLSHFFYPETGGTPNRLVPIAQLLHETGNDVHVITNKPNHPEGRIRERYRGGLFRRSKQFGIPVTYCWVYATPRKSFIHRILNYLSFMVMGTIAGARVPGKFDIVFASSPPLPVGIAGWAVARLKRARFVFDVRDLWPEVAVALGELRHATLIRWAERMERFVYQSADAISTVTARFQADIKTAVGESKPVILVRNGTLPELFARSDLRETLRNELGAGDRLVVLFGGNLGVAQGLGHLANAADLANQRHLPVLFVFLGSGPRGDVLKEEVTRRGLTNVVFRERTDLETAAGYFSAADALLVPLSADPVFRKYIPSKLFDAMAAGRPVLLGVDGEARDLLEAHEAGIFYAPEDAAALVTAIERLLADPDGARRMGENGRDAAVRLYSRKQQARLLLNLFEALTSNRSHAEGASPTLGRSD